MPIQLNRPGPLQRDIARFIRAAERMGLPTDGHTANTGTVYITIHAHNGQRIYRFASHSECYTTHDYSICSGSTQPSPYTSLPLGYDGWTSCAIIDLATWAEQPHHPAARQASQARARAIHAIQQERLWRERRQKDAAQAAAAATAAKLHAYGILGRACLRVARQYWPHWPCSTATDRNSRSNACHRVLQTISIEHGISIKLLCDATEP